ncbi:MAG: Ti-type conjugative transfer relaxase TraA, partial [Janthinobacterium lividum]
MALYHFSAKIIGRSAGRSSVAAAAYRAAEELEDLQVGRVHDYTAKQDVVYSEILLPDDAPVRLLDRSTLWNEVEATEKRKDSQLARDIEIALPRELSQAEAIALVRDFVSEQFVARGMVADLNVHWGRTADGEEQPHAHVMLTMRRVEPMSPSAVERNANGRATNHERYPGRGARRARGLAGDPAVDAGDGGRSDRSDPDASTIDPEQSAEHSGTTGNDRAAARLARLIAAARLRLGLRRHAVKASVGMGFGPKVTEWNSTALLMNWRERWAEMANERLSLLGHDARIDHRSNADQGIELEPQHKIGPAGARREDRGEDAERAAEHRAIARRNGGALFADPSIALDALTQQHSTFTRQNLARFVDRHTDGAEQFASVLSKVEAAPELVRLGKDVRGRERFTTQAMLEAERRMEQAATAMAGQDGHAVSRATALRAAQRAEANRLELGNEQKAALLHVTTGPDLALVVGFAGTGKSAMLGVARTAWETAGYRVRGAALSGIAAEGLEAGSGIASRTLASLEFAWKDDRDLLTSTDVLVVDEAGMIGSRQMERVLSAARAAGAKVVLVGDPEQLQAIEAGAAFRALAERHGARAITAVRRQREDWQRAATRELATGRTAEALERYGAAGVVLAAGTRDEAKVALVAGWDVARQQSPTASQVILAYTRDDVRDLNRLARERMRASEELRGADQVVQTERGERAFAAGDRIMFQRNERGLGGQADGRNGVAVKNGTLGTVLEVASGGERLTVRLDGAGQEEKDGRMVTFDARDYAHIDHGYAATVHKAQGVTVDRAHVLATPHMDRHAAYVGLTRHRDGVALHYASEDFADPARLARSLGRERAKDTTLDYDRDEDLMRRYAERRGLDRLYPQSEIVLAPAPVQQPEAGLPALRRSRFAGLRLKANRPVEGSVPAAPEPPPQTIPARIPTEREQERARLKVLMAP